MLAAPEQRAAIFREYALLTFRQLKLDLRKTAYFQAETHRVTVVYGVPASWKKALSKVARD